MFVDESALDKFVENSINGHLEFMCLDDFSKHLNGRPANEKEINFCLDNYSFLVRKKFDEFSAKYVSLKKTYDYMRYGEEHLFKQLERIIKKKR